MRSLDSLTLHCTDISGWEEQPEMANILSYISEDEERKTYKTLIHEHQYNDWNHSMYSNLRFVDVKFY